MTQTQTNQSVESDDPIALLKAAHKEARAVGPEFLSFWKDRLRPLFEAVIEDYSLQLDDIDETLEALDGSDNEDLTNLVRECFNGLQLMVTLNDILLREGGYLNGEGLTDKELPEDFRKLYPVAQGLVQSLRQNETLAALAEAEASEATEDDGEEEAETEEGDD